MSDAPANAERASSKHQVPLLCLALAALTLCVFWPATTGEFLDWDDTDMVVKNPSLNPPTWQGVWERWTSSYQELYTPVPATLWIGLASAARVQLEDGRWVLNPWIFHWGSLLLHLASVLVVYALLRQITGENFASAAGAAIFAIHPLQIEAVAWISGLEDVCCVLFMALCLWQYLLYARGDRNKRSHYIVALIGFILALVSKPNAVAVPVMAWALDRWVVGRSTQASAKSLWAWVVLAIPIAIATRHIQPVSNLPEMHSELWKRPIIAVDALAFYVRKLFWPVDLGIHYGRTPASVSISSSWFIALAIVIITTLLIWGLSRWRRSIAGGGIIALGAVGPVLGFVPFAFQTYSTVADRYMYPAMIGVAIIVSCLLAPRSSGAAKRDPLSRNWVWPVVLLMVAALAIRAFNQAETWQNNVLLFTNALRVNRNSWLAYNDLAAVLLQRKDALNAERYAARALELRPQLPIAHIHRGSALSMLNRPREAIAEYKLGLEGTPNDAVAHQNLAGAYVEIGEYNNAIRQYRIALQVDPSNRRVQRLLALVMRASAGTRPSTTRSSSPATVNSAPQQ